MKKKLIIFTHSAGRLGNQLIAFAHLIAFWNEHHEKFNILNLSFWPYLHLMNFSSSLKYCFLSKDKKHLYFFKFLFLIYSILPKPLNDKFHKILIITCHQFSYFFYGFQSIFSNKSSIWAFLQPYCPGQEYEYLDLNNLQTITLLSKAHSCVAGFKFKSWDLVLKHKQTLHYFLEFNIKFQQNSHIFIRPLVKKYKTLIGVHIRQGDRRKQAKSHQKASGIISFPASVYANYMHQLKLIFGEDTGFLLTSDEIQNMSLFKDFNVHLCTGSMGQKGNFVESILELAECNYLLMPDTTFSGWASFLKNIPIFLIRSPNEILSINNLSSIEDTSGFIN